MRRIYFSINSLLFELTKSACVQNSEHKCYTESVYHLYSYHKLLVTNDLVLSHKLIKTDGVSKNANFQLIFVSQLLRQTLLDFLLKAAYLPLFQKSPSLLHWMEEKAVYWLSKVLLHRVQGTPRIQVSCHMISSQHVGTTTRHKL